MAKPPDGPSTSVQNNAREIEIARKRAEVAAQLRNNPPKGKK
jgi:hypothetical protein